MPEPNLARSAPGPRTGGWHEPPTPLVRPITHAGHAPPALEQLTAVLESTCGMLVALESLRSCVHDLADEVRTAHLHLADATASLRSAIAELRALHEGSASTLGLGFVLAAPGSGRHRERVYPQRSAS